MNEQEQEQFMQLVRKAEQEEALRIQAQTQVNNMSGYQAGKEPNIIEYQLDVSPTLDRVFHLLSGHIATVTNGKETWEEPEDDRLKILSPYGVKQVMNYLAIYINPNTLLSNFTVEQIEEKTKTFGVALSDLLFNRYEHFFYYPSPEELFETYKPIMDKKYKGKMTSDELYQKCVQWSREELQMKFRHYDMIVNLVTDTVHATLLRALNGKERESLRKQINIHESLNKALEYGKNNQKEFKMTSPSTWGR